MDAPKHARGLTVSQIYDFEVQTIDGNTETLSSLRGRVLLIVNVASKCGFTPQYEGLEKLYRKYREKGLVILGFPCNQFGGQEPGAESDIKSFCSLTYGATFPMFTKVDVNGDKAHPLFQFLKKEEKGILGTEAIKWNFTKFLVSRTGQVLKRYAPTTTPESLAGDIESALKTAPN